MTRIAVHQSRTGIDPTTNAAALVAAIDAAHAGGAAMLFTPENGNLMDRDRNRAAAHRRAEADDPVVAAVRAAAARTGIWVQLGSVGVALDDGRLANRSLLIDGGGAVRARYDKMHLFDVDLPDGQSWRESAAYRAGEEAVVADTPAGRIGLSICYDLRFPALYQALSAAGATVLSVPAAFTVPTGQAHWHLLLRARAVETGCYVVAAAQAGVHADGRETYGRSLVVDPWGDILLDMGDDLGVAFAEIADARVAEVRGRIPTLAHRRTIRPARVCP
ncbi:carbon-nitrogen hydrolase family protein [Sphingomonas montana]|uniref:carbon-nitrogen hydrolase family protein n=1 Tax=Sphingomonas montana TaxID=1843236 RepID=UPI00096FF9DE|nr:carbon-nitrogen hydrolase family protein [Sphingomonas montana]